MFRSWGADLINMTTCPEATLAKEAGLLYAAFAMSTGELLSYHPDELTPPAPEGKTFTSSFVLHFLF